MRCPGHRERPGLISLPRMDPLGPNRAPPSEELKAASLASSKGSPLTQDPFELPQGVPNLNLDTMEFGAQTVLLLWGCAGCCKGSSSTSGLYPLEAGSSFSWEQLNMVPEIAKDFGGQNAPWPITAELDHGLGNIVLWMSRQLSGGRKI